MPFPRLRCHDANRYSAICTCKLSQKGKVPGRSWWSHIRPDGVWSNASISSLLSPNICRGGKKHKSLGDPGKHKYSGREVFILRPLRLSRDVPDCYRSLFGPTERSEKSECSLFPRPLLACRHHKRPQDRTGSDQTGSDRRQVVGSNWNVSGSAAPVKSGITFQRCADSGPGQSKPGGSDGVEARPLLGEFHPREEPLPGIPSLL